jgi:alkanesulfonate monooxygenase SsuD/methylene tetrahydromethanopterin reductase-like flavin-dependent oxidoreductase (luciferase family)
MLACSFVGSPQTVERELQGFIARTGVDELMVACAIYDQQEKLRSYELLKGLNLAPSDRAAA